MVIQFGNAGVGDSDNSQSKFHQRHLNHKEKPTFFGDRMFVLNLMERKSKRFFVQKLKSASIELNPSNSHSLKSVSFNTKYYFKGHFKLPSLIMNEWTTRKLLNLVTYEICLGDSNSNHYLVTSYISFMDLLIDTEQDVRE